MSVSDDDIENTDSSEELEVNVEPQNIVRMATYQVQPPENFNFAKPDDWPKWLKRFERFRIAAELGAKEGPIQVNTFVYAMGGEAEDVIKSFGLTDEESKNCRKEVRRLFCDQAEYHLRKSKV